MRILLTGSAGFTGHHFRVRAEAAGHEVVPLTADLTDRPALAAEVARAEADAVVHLAAQAGVRYSITHPNAYLDSNLSGFGHVLEGCRAQKLGHLVYASSSSVYGGNT